MPLRKRNIGSRRKIFTREILHVQLVIQKGTCPSAYLLNWGNRSVIRFQSEHASSWKAMPEFRITISATIHSDLLVNYTRYFSRFMNANLMSRLHVFDVDQRMECEH